MNIWDHISIDPKVCHGKPCIKGTRIPVAVILRALGAGASVEEIIEEYPPITEEDIRAAILYAAMLADEETILLEAA